MCVLRSKYRGTRMNNLRHTELVFEVTEEADGGYVAECLTESIVTQGDTWEELRAMVKDAVDAYFFDGPKPEWIRLHLVHNEVLSMK
jgi:predicted RNase H-like HicB family nuclease